MANTNVKAILSLILGIVSLFLFWIPLIGLVIVLATLILGIVSLKQISNNKKQSGKGLAITGIVLGGVLIIPSLVMLVGGLTFMGAFSSNDRYLPTNCVLDGKLECGNAFNLGSDGTLMMQIKNNNVNDITINKVSIIEKSINDDTKKCEVNTNTVIKSGVFQDLELNFDGIGCGIKDNAGLKKSFDLNIEYNLDGSTISSISNGELTTTIN
ncbi:MAG: DUF4190 domain-containing protein [Candidatus Woesearchaeota archaeon]